MCGLAGIIPVNIHKGKTVSEDALKAELSRMEGLVQEIIGACYTRSNRENDRAHEGYLGGIETVTALWDAAKDLRKDDPFQTVFTHPEIHGKIRELCEKLSDFLKSEEKLFADHVGHLEPAQVETMTRAVDTVKDIAWSLDREVSENIGRVKDLMGIASAEASDAPLEITQANLRVFRKINTVFNSIDRLEVRGRDSAGISLLFILDTSDIQEFKAALEADGAGEDFDARIGHEVLLNRGIALHEITVGEGKRVALSLTYKVSAEVGSLGDNIAFLREQIRSDNLLHAAARLPYRNYTVLSHTRWASVGGISEPNCHPVDNRVICNPNMETAPGDEAILHVCLNGDIDNYEDLKRESERDGDLIHDEITTDTKIIPLRVETYLRQGFAVEQAFRMALNDFDGSHAIAMQTDLAPGKLFLAQRGSGQALFIGLAENHYLPTSEVYGFIEDTNRFLKLDGEKVVDGKNGPTQGQLFILDQNSEGGLAGIRAMYYDGTPFRLTEENVRTTELTSRDIDRQEFEHYFLKEISEAPDSVEKTLLNRWKVAETEDGSHRYVISLDRSVVPDHLEEAIVSGKIRRIFFVGQGTAGVAAQACADIFTHYLNDPSLVISAMKASELSGFKLGADRDMVSMSDALVVAISQSGTTTDTNRAVDMAKERGAKTIGIVNRRDSDLTFKADGVLYTSSGRDIEMSVASTKAFYSQIVAGAMLGLFLTSLKGTRNDEAVAHEVKRLLALPAHMRKVLTLAPQVEAAAKQYAVTRTYWAVVGSGPNKASADEIRIKLSELCYKTISSDYVEDKKHIDLSSEPLIIVCAAGVRPTVIGDIVKDTAIFKAHKAIPIVIVDEGENRFDSHAAAVFHVPAVPEYLAPIVNTLAGHIWGYYSALAINDGSRFLYEFRQEIRSDLAAYQKSGMGIYEVVLEKPFREKIARFYTVFRKKRADHQLPGSLDIFSDLTLLLKYLSGRLPVTDFELDFGIKGTAQNMIDTFFAYFSRGINAMARPVDAIKHQAKTVTVGTSRISEKFEGILFDILPKKGFAVFQLTPVNLLVVKNLQGIIDAVKGLTLYKVTGLDLLGEPTGMTRVEVLTKEGTSAGIASRVEKDHKLQGTKLIIVRQGNVYIGKGRKDQRSIVYIPILSDASETPNTIEHLMLLHIEFKKEVPLSTRIKALGGKYQHIKDLVLESSIPWEDRYLELVPIDELFGRSAEKVSEIILSDLHRKSA